jgi:5'-3' exonuclease
MTTPNKNTIYKYFKTNAEKSIQPKQCPQGHYGEKNIVFIDASYYCFYRFHAIHGWMKHKRGPEFNLAEATEEDQQLFINTFKSCFIETLNTLPKMLHLTAENTQIIVSQDCPREKIWRTELYPEYKACRKSTPEIGKFFQLIDNENLFRECPLVSHIIGHPHLEADDCIALSVKHLHEKKPNYSIYIIASDKDYLQLARENVKIIDLKFRDLTQQKSSSNNAADDLQMKIIMGDKSDNIPAIFPKCGPKTAKKCLEDSTFFATKLADPECREKYEFNQRLICFDFIPENIVTEFMQTIAF